MKNFKELSEEIRKNKSVASLDPRIQADPRTYTTKVGIVRRAKENLVELFLEYRKLVMSKAVFILANGSKSDTFIEVAKKEYGCFSVPVDEVYEKIVSAVHPRNYQNTTASASIFDILMSSFNDVCDDIGIIGYPAVLFEMKYRRNLKTKQDLIDLTKEAFNDKVGSELVGLFAVDKVSRKAISEDYDGSTIPIILYSDDKKLMKELESTLKNINTNVFTLNITKKQTKELVEEKLLNIRTQIK